MSVHLARGRLLFQQGRHDLAEAEFRHALAEDPNNDNAHALLALCLAIKESFDEAQRESAEAIRLAPDEPFNHYVMSQVLTDRNMPAQAEAAARQAIALDPYNADYWAALAFTRFNQRDWNDTLNAAEQGLQSDPEHVECNNLRAMALTKLGRRDEAGQTLHAALARQPEDAYSHANMGWTLLHEGDPTKAMEHFREALRLDPDMDWARQGIVEALKARNILYRAMLAYFLWMSRIGHSAQWMIVIGGWLGIRFLRQMMKQNPRLAPVAIPVLILYVLFVFLSWTAPALFNLMLRLDKFGRLVLSREERIASNFVGGAALLALALVVLALTLKVQLFLYAAIGAVALIIPIAAVFQVPAGWPRLVMTLYTLALVAVALAIPFVPPKTVGTLITTFLFGLLLSGFLANALMQARVTR
jgi:tetratricopeptide (TPR) repeat protein